MDDIRITEITAEALDAHLPALAEITKATVDDGAAISFVHPFTLDDAEAFWRESVAPKMVRGEKVLLGAFIDDRVVGTVQLDLAMPPNQPHRCEVAKMAVHPAYRRRGIGRALMLAIEAEARKAGKTLMTLDTRTDDLAQGLYGSVGFEIAGVIPYFALDPDGQSTHGTTYMYKPL
ncbi:MAG: GNAT family N-acetyltransferase [Pseudomonadota bacterium]